MGRLRAKNDAGSMLPSRTFSHPRPDFVPEFAPPAGAHRSHAKFNCEANKGATGKRSKVLSSQKDTLVNAFYRKSVASILTQGCNHEIPTTFDPKNYAYFCVKFLQICRLNNLVNFDALTFR